MILSKIRFRKFVHCARMPPEKKLRQEDFPGANFEELLAEMTYGMRRKRKVC